MRFALLHSPLVGPGTWVPVAEALRATGHDAKVPDLRASAETGEPEAVIAAAAESVSNDGVAAVDVVVAHSGAGLLLPAVVDRVHPAPRLAVFVDAGVPPCAGAGSVGLEFLSWLRELADDDGLLPKWSAWWGPDAMASLVPDPEIRAAIERELPSVPVRFFETPIETPDGWCSRPAAYILLSAAYRDDAATATSIGWPVRRYSGGHLDIINRSDLIAADLVDLAG